MNALLQLSLLVIIPRLKYFPYHLKKTLTDLHQLEGMIVQITKV
jgi:hypothetical protein